MKVTAVFVAALATLGAASPPKGCTPGTYSCTGDAKGWQVCDVTRTWVFAGACPPYTSCIFYKPSKSPYCVPPKFKFPQN
ncbi:hypothetical protein NW767_003084 [Fusarium falciforme]|uniref:CBM1 domain-containing protein n=1 Tax=Fusarium falciforme TaxID=195108 RepID=A0A9W8UZS8_9HYPO|nr:hypothetical protein NW755_008134 [Fusarium falciforme]KAJ4206794.1 hypothetical protein NW767_003084 [Fusarium falciforme]KAJ4260871.1 hypothetical protein NW757_001257 [Fusarium falciforme]